MKALKILCALLLGFAVMPRAGATDVSGTIGTSTWTKAQSPYRVTRTITILSGSTLSIEPGVEVLFDADVQFVVQGVLNAVGTETDSIRFLKGAAVEWGGLRISGGGSSTIAYARVSDGHADRSPPNNRGGGISVQDSKSRLALAHVVISGNTAARGGGLSNQYSATATLTSCTIRGNTADDYGGGLYNVDATATLTSCRITGNTASCGGGLANDWDATATLVDCTISDNTALRRGGGLYLYNNSAATLVDCTITGNTVDDSASSADP